MITPQKPGAPKWREAEINLVSPLKTRSPKIEWFPYFLSKPKIHPKQKASLANSSWGSGAAAAASDEHDHEDGVCAHPPQHTQAKKKAGIRNQNLETWLWGFRMNLGHW